MANGLQSPFPGEVLAENTALSLVVLSFADLATRPYYKDQGSSAAGEPGASTPNSEHHSNLKREKDKATQIGDGVVVTYGGWFGAVDDGRWKRIRTPVFSRMPYAAPSENGPLTDYQ